MAKKRQNTESVYKCGDCLHSKGHYNLNHEGKPIMGMCEFSKHSHLLSQGACKWSFKMKRVNV